MITDKPTARESLARTVSSMALVLNAIVRFMEERDRNERRPQL